MRVINLFAGPGAGKSTTATGVFTRLKQAGINAEYVPEYAKDLTWAERDMSNQTLILGKQYERLRVLRGKVDIAVTDSPLLLTQVYNRTLAGLNQVAANLYESFDNINYFVQRVKPYSTAGRKESEEEAKLLDARIKSVLTANGVVYTEILGNAGGIEAVFHDMLRMRVMR